MSKDRIHTLIVVELAETVLAVANAKLGEGTGAHQSALGIAVEQLGKTQERIARDLLGQTPDRFPSYGELLAARTRQDAVIVGITSQVNALQNDLDLAISLLRLFAETAATDSPLSNEDDAVLRAFLAKHDPMPEENTDAS